MERVRFPQVVLAGVAWRAVLEDRGFWLPQLNYEMAIGLGDFNKAARNNLRTDHGGNTWLHLGSQGRRPEASNPPCICEAVRRRASYGRSPGGRFSPPHLNQTWEILICSAAPDEHDGNAELLSAPNEHDTNEIRCTLNVERAKATWRSFIEGERPKATWRRYLEIESPRPLDTPR